MRILKLPRYLFLILVWFYQKFLSPDHSFWAKVVYPNGFCKFTPTCSEYGYRVVKKYGLVIGLPKALWRILRCNPWSVGGEDLPN